MNISRDTGYRDEVARLTPNLRRFARALVRDHDTDTSDDLVQATLVRALASDQDRRGTRLVIWLMSVLTGLHRAQARDVGSDKKLRSGGGHEGESIPSGKSWNGLRPSRQRDTALLSSIPLECREVLLLVVLENLSYSQVAESLGLPINTVVTRLARAREHLAQAQRATPAAQAPAHAPRVVPYLRVIK